MSTSKSNWIHWLFLFPAIFLLTVFLVYPTLQTIWYSVHQGSLLNPTAKFIGLDNYVRLLTNDRFFLKLDQWPPSGSLVNTAVWLVLFTSAIVAIALMVAVLADRVRYETIIKSVIFLPMVISATAASVIFRFVYSPDTNIGVLNAFLSVIVPNFEPIAWLGRTDLVNLAAIAAGVWIWTGLAMVVLSAAYKALPKDVLEAAKVDGANAWNTFWQIIVPMLAQPLAFVAITMIINALKIMDLIVVMTQGGPRGASRVIGFTVYWELFNNAKVGYGSAVAIMMFILLIPIMVIQIRNIQAQ